MVEQLTQAQHDALLKQIFPSGASASRKIAHCVRFFLALVVFIAGEILSLSGGLQFD